MTFKKVTAFKAIVASLNILLLVLGIGVAFKRDFHKTDTRYASSLFRRDQVLEGVPVLDTLSDVDGPSRCLLHCMKRKPDCKAFNYGFGNCTLLVESVCFNESLVLTPAEGYHYYDIMETPDFEKKHYKDKYCQQFGKCSGNCYPRKPHYVDERMTKTEAVAYCDKLGRSLAQPRSFDENGFYASFIKNLLKEQPETRTQKDMKYWIGISDAEMEGFWIYDDGSPVSESFSAWALGQPDNGGPFGSGREDCAVVGESGDFRWFDVSCNSKLKFFCA